MAHKHNIRQTPGHSSGPTEWDVILTEMKAQLYMHCGTLLIRLAKDVCSLLIYLNYDISRRTAVAFLLEWQGSFFSRSLLVDLTVLTFKFFILAMKRVMNN